jgi:hypothetical protein
MMPVGTTHEEDVRKYWSDARTTMTVLDWGSELRPRTRTVTCHHRRPGGSLMSRRLRAIALSFVLALIGLVAPPAPPVAATSITVNTATDPAPNSAGVFPTNRLCSLRAAMLSALNNTNAADADCATGLGGGVLDVIQIDASARRSMRRTSRSAVATSLASSRPAS